MSSPFGFMATNLLHECLTIQACNSYFTSASKCIQAISSVLVVAENWSVPSSNPFAFISFSRTSFILGLCLRTRWTHPPAMSMTWSTLHLFFIVDLTVASKISAEMASPFSTIETCKHARNIDHVQAPISTWERSCLHPIFVHTLKYQEHATLLHKSLMTIWNVETPYRSCTN